MGRWIRIGVAAVLAAGAVAVGVASSPVAHAETTATPGFALKLAQGGCLNDRTDIYVDVVACSAGSGAQRVRLAHHPAGDYRLIMQGSDLGTCLGYEGSTAQGAKVISSQCDNSSRQRWSFHINELEQIVFKNRANGWCLAGFTGSDARLDTCDASFSQFYLVPLGSNLRLRPTHSNKCLDVDTSVGGGLGEGALVQQYTCFGPGQTNQKWRLEVRGWPYVPTCGFPSGCGPYTVPTSYYVRAQHSNLCPSHDNRATNGYQIRQESCNVWDTTWSLHPVLLSPDRMTFQVRRYQSLGTDFDCLDVDNGGAGQGQQDGAKVQLWDCLPNQTNQIWSIEIVS